MARNRHHLVNEVGISLQGFESACRELDDFIMALNNGAKLMNLSADQLKAEHLPQFDKYLRASMSRLDEIMALVSEIHETP